MCIRDRCQARCSDAPSSWEFSANHRRQGFQHQPALVQALSPARKYRSMVMKRQAYRVFGYLVLLLAILSALVIDGGSYSQSFAETSTDLYFKTPGTPEGPPAPSPEETVYSRIGSFDSRLLV